MADWDEEGIIEYYPLNEFSDGISSVVRKGKLTDADMSDINTVASAADNNGNDPGAASYLAANQERLQSINSIWDQSEIDFSVALQFYYGAAISNTYLFSQYETGQTSRQKMHLRFQPSNLRFQIVNMYHSATSNVQLNMIFTTGNWYRVLCEYNRAARVLTLQCEGNSVTGSQMSVQFASLGPNTSIPMCIGGFQSNPSFAFTGRVSNVIFASRLFTASEKSSWLNNWHDENSLPIGKTSRIVMCGRKFCPVKQ